MRRVLVLSDTHGRIKEAMDVVEAIGKIDLIIHLGDLVRDAKTLAASFPTIPLVYVKGNNDWGEQAPLEQVVPFEGHRIYCLHGHTSAMYHLEEYARKEGCDVALYGHTHRSECTQRKGLLVMNPGSISRPRDGQYSYGILETEEGKIKGCICTL